LDRQSLTKAQRWELADVLAEERLPKINSNLDTIELPNTFYVNHGKRIIDVVVSTIVLIILAPINFVLGVITLFDVGLPLFFKQQRVGRNGKLFQIVKFRNMTNEKDSRGELLPPEKRVTRFGGFMRKTSLDELLNFWSIFKGDMSIIGPRPLVPEYVHRYNRRHKGRLLVRPGLECPPRSLDSSVWTWQEQFDNDVWYVENLSLKTDVYMFINLIKFTFNKEIAEARVVAERGTFMGYDENGNAINLDGVPQQLIDELFGGAE
jgi:lipopolysaccharide/colanic/teichoic acid biosynthesis glycosyltransferase